MKKSIGIILSTLLVVFMTACGTNNTAELPTCEIASCSEPIYKDDLCADHYVENELSIVRCSEASCAEVVYKDGLCVDHYVNNAINKNGTSEEEVAEPTTEPTPIPTPTPEPTSTPTPKPTATPKPTNTPKPTPTPTNIPVSSAEDIYEKAIVSVVEITATNSFGGGSTGTGFFYDKKGTVITNYHVIEGCDAAYITLSNGKEYDVEKVLGYNVEKDIAILSTDCSSSTPLKFRSSNVKTGETVYAIGSSLGLEGSLSDGLISAAEREVDGNIYIQTTAPISHGNSGGPLLDKEGLVVGITSASFVDGQNLNLAIPVAEVEKISIKTPVTMAELCKPDVEWLMGWDFFYYDEEESYVFAFMLGDKNKNLVEASGTVELSITNNDGTVVYDGKGDFTGDFYEEWTYDESIEKTLITFYISPEDIDKGTTSEGKVSFVVYGENFSFDEEIIEVYDLPIEQAVLASDYLVEWLMNNGELYGSSYFVSYTTDADENGVDYTHLISYDINSQSLSTSVGHYSYGTCMTFCSINLEDTDGLHIYSVKDYYYSPGAEIYGRIDGNSYTTKSALSYEINTSTNIQWDEYARSMVNLALIFFDDYLTQCIPEIDITDFGFLNF